PALGSAGRGGGGSRDHSLGLQSSVDLVPDAGDRTFGLDSGGRGQGVGYGDRYVLVGGGERSDARRLQGGQHVLGEGIRLDERPLVVQSTQSGRQAAHQRGGEL